MRSKTRAVSIFACQLRVFNANGLQDAQQTHPISEPGQVIDFLLEFV